MPRFSLRLLAMLAAFSATSDIALAGNRYDGGHARQSVQGHASDERRQDVERSVRLNSKVRNERLPIRQLLEIGPRFDGAVLRAVTLDIRPRGRTTRFTLLANGQPIAESWSGRGDSFVRLRPYEKLRLGRDINRLQVAVEGSARIEHLSARLVRPAKSASRHWQNGGWRHYDRKSQHSFGHGRSSFEQRHQTHQQGINGKGERQKQNDQSRRGDKWRSDQIVWRYSFD